jgi:hypothetical protein
MAVLSGKPQHRRDSISHQMLTLGSVCMSTPKDPGMQCERTEIRVRVHTAPASWSELNTKRCSFMCISIFRVLTVKLTQLPPSVVSIFPDELQVQSAVPHSSGG